MVKYNVSVEFKVKSDKLRDWIQEEWCEYTFTSCLTDRKFELEFPEGKGNIMTAKSTNPITVDELKALIVSQFGLRDDELEITGYITHKSETNRQEPKKIWELIDKEFTNNKKPEELQSRTAPTVKTAEKKKDKFFDVNSFDKLMRDWVHGFKITTADVKPSGVDTDGDKTSIELTKLREENAALKKKLAEKEAQIEDLRRAVLVADETTHRIVERFL